MMTELCVVLTTAPVDIDADAIAETLVARRLAACVNVLPAMSSTYTWQGRVERSDERQLLIKTSRERIEELQAVLANEHPYDVPEFLVLPVVGGSPAYLDWLRAAVAATPDVAS